MFNLEIGRFIAATNKSVAPEIPEAAQDVAGGVVGEVIEIRVAVAAANLRPEARRKFGFLSLNRGGVVRGAK
jgi:hypothetical protein